MKWLRSLLLIAVGVVVFPNLAWCRNIEGHVYFTEPRTPAANVMVSLQSAEESLLDSGQTGLNGEFSFHNLLASTYTLSVDLQGFQKISVDVDLTMTSEKDVEIELTKTGDKKGAAKSPGSVVSAHILSMPGNARTAFDAGELKLLHDKNAEASVTDFEKAVDVAPSFYEAYEQLGLAYMLLAKPDDAEKALRKSIELSGDKYAPSDFDLGSLEMNRREFKDGEKIVRHGLELEPNAWLGHYELGRALYYEKRVPEALKSAEQARTLQPDAPVLYRLLAIIHMSQHDNLALLEDLNAYIKLDPDSTLGVRAKQLRDQVSHSPDSSSTSNPIRP